MKPPRNKNGGRMPPIHVRRKAGTPEHSETRVRTVHVSELSRLKMVAGNETRYRCVIDGDALIEWVGFGWIMIRPATPEDRRSYPRVVRGSQ